MDDSVARYCDYLDKEMTIMGLLSGFAIIVPALFLDRTAGAPIAEPTFLSTLWATERPFVIAGCIACMVAALCFYSQRSLLAYFVGQIMLSTTPAAYKNSPTKKLIEEADAWSTWHRYSAGFAFLFAGFALYAVALLHPYVAGALPWSQGWTIAAVLAPFMVGVGTQIAVRHTFRYEDEPWVELVNWLRQARKRT